MSCGVHVLCHHSCHHLIGAIDGRYSAYQTMRSWMRNLMTSQATMCLAGPRIVMTRPLLVGRLTE